MDDLTKILKDMDAITTPEPRKLRKKHEPEPEVEEDDPDAALWAQRYLKGAQTVEKAEEKVEKAETKTSTGIQLYPGTKTRVVKTVHRDSDGRISRVEEEYITEV